MHVMQSLPYARILVTYWSSLYLQAALFDVGLLVQIEALNEPF